MGRACADQRSVRLSCLVACEPAVYVALPLGIPLTNGSVSLSAQNGPSSSAARAAMGVVSKSPVSVGTSLSVARTALDNPCPLPASLRPLRTPRQQRSYRSIGSCFFSGGCSLAREGQPACAARLRRTAGGVLDADQVRSADDSIDVADLVGENQLDVGRALDGDYIVGSARRTTRTVTAKVRSAWSIRWGRRRATQRMSG
jgi:hypothetical protein